MSATTAHGYLAMMPRIRAEERLDMWEVFIMAAGSIRGGVRNKWLRRLTKTISGPRRAEQLSPEQRKRRLEQLGIQVLGFPPTGGDAAS